MREHRCRRLLWLLALLMACLMLTGCRKQPPGGAEASDGVQVLLDGKAWDGKPVSPDDEGLRVYITLDGKDLIDLPFAQAREVTILQPDGAENAVTLTGEAVYMVHANCENQDCVNMGEVTKDNMELRVMGGFIICLPHRISVEVRE